MDFETAYRDALDLQKHLLPAMEWLVTHINQFPNGVDIPVFHTLGKDVWIDERAEIGGGTIIFPGCKILGPSKIGKRCILYPNTLLLNTTIGDETIIALPILKNSTIGNRCVIGGTAELNRTVLGNRVNMVHHGYLGDAMVGDDSNIGAGAITANYDGKQKNKTVFGRKTFLGVNANIIAPNGLPDGTLIAAGSTIPANIANVRAIPPFSMLVARIKEVIIKARK